MKHKTFFWFFLPTGLAMLLFIAYPIISVIIQSLHSPHEAVLIETENCGPFGCTTETTIDQEATAALRASSPQGKFVGFSLYLDRGHLAVDEVSSAWANNDSWKGFFKEMGNLPLYRALAFTLTYTFVCTPFLMILGLMIALAVNTLSNRLKGLMIFFSLLPLIVPPLVGSLVLFWMVDSRGVLGSALQWLADDPTLSVKANTIFMWIMLIIYGIWQSTPFAFIVFYAGLQTIPMDQLESSQIDGATRWQQIRFVIIPHLMPLITFVALIQLMDNFRVFEPIIGFNSAAHATSLSWIIFNDLSGETRLLNSAATTSVMTIIGVGILLTPVLIRTWRDFQGKA